MLTKGYTLHLEGGKVWTPKWWCRIVFDHGASVTTMHRGIHQGKSRSALTILDNSVTVSWHLRQSWLENSLKLGRMCLTQPCRVGSFSGGGPADLQGGPIFFQMRQSRRTNKSRRAITLAGGPAPLGSPPDAMGLVSHANLLIFL